MQREKSLDIAKGIAIILVMYGHLKYTEVNRDTLYCWIYSFHMPLFIYISGMLATQDKENRWNRLLKKGKRIIIPYIVANICGYCIQSFLQIQKLSVKQFLHGTIVGDNLISNLPTWYLMSYFWIFLFALYLLPLLDSVRKLIIADIMAIVGVFIVASLTNVQDYFRLKGAVVLLPFFVTGYLFKRIEVKVPWWSIIILFGIGYGTGRLNALQSRRYVTVGNGDVCVPYFYLISAICTGVALVELCKYLEKIRIVNLLEIYGKHSMMILCTHWILGNVMAEYMEYGIVIFVAVLLIETEIIIVQECFEKVRKQESKI